AYPNTGDVSDLALLPSHLAVGMGVVDVRTESIQSTEAMEALGVAGARLIDPGRIALNPDCGFAPGAGEPPSIDEAYAKLRRMTRWLVAVRPPVSLPQQIQFLRPMAQGFTARSEAVEGWLHLVNPPPEN